MTPIDVATIRRAAERLAGRIVRTPLLASAMLDELAGAKVLVKAEPLQKTGSFKIRGALNKILSTPAEERLRRLLVGQPRPGGRGRGPHGRCAGCDRDAEGRAFDQDRELPLVGRRGRLL